jgi:oxygen-independent coproporphyrinogen III oxidase
MRMSGIYIHIPFCKQACHYCDFHFSTSLKKKSALVDAICRELELRKTETHQQTIETVYFGGGTPSLLTQNELNHILNSIHKNYNVDAQAEWTLEANPDDLSKQKIEELYQAGFNRLSIGIQSFFEEDLKLMNRAHDATEALLCLEHSRKRFDNISADLIYGIPGLTSERWQKNIETLLSFDIPHISSYALTVEPKTALQKFIEKGIVPLPDDEEAQAHFMQLLQVLEAAGFEHYELSNFAKPGFYSKNNSRYWLGYTYLGIGPSAHSYNGEHRGWNVSNNSIYINEISQDKLSIEIETLTTTDRYNEYIMTGLRTRWGVSLTRVEREFGELYKKYLLEQAQKHLLDHLLFIDEDVLYVSRKGKFLSDGIASDLFMLNLG